MLYLLSYGYNKGLNSKRELQPHQVIGNYAIWSTVILL